jgi:hypothetical protein
MRAGAAKAAGSSSPRFTTSLSSEQLHTAGVDWTATSPAVVPVQALLSLMPDLKTL